MKQIFRSIFGRQHGRDHLDFWLGSRLGLPPLTSKYYHLKGKVGEEQDSTPTLFCTALDFISESIEDGLFSVSDISEITTKQIYTSLLETLPRPQIEFKRPEQDWPLTWERLKSGAISSEARSYLYLIIHDRVSTRERGNRLMPGRFPSNLCGLCGNSVESCTHRYLYCEYVSEVWEWIWATSQILEPTLAFSDETSLLRFDFPKGLRENSILWLVGNFIELVEKEVVSKGKVLKLSCVLGYLKQKKTGFSSSSNS